MGQSPDELFARLPRGSIRIAAQLRSRYSVLVWWAYVTRADFSTGEVSCSKETIAEIIGSKSFQARDVRRCVLELIAAGLLEELGEHKAYGRTVQKYRVRGAVLGATTPGAITPGAVSNNGQASHVLEPLPPGVRTSRPPGPRHRQSYSSSEEENKYIGSGEAPHVAARGASGDQEAPFGRPEQDQEGADAPAVEREVAWGGRSAYAEVDARAAAEEALIAQHRAKQEQAFLNDCIQSEAEALLQAGVYSTLPPPARLPALSALTRDYRTRWPRSWPSSWILYTDSLNGQVSNKPAFLTAHLEGYARGNWIPENKTEPERFDHLRLLKGEPA